MFVIELNSFTFVPLVSLWSVQSQLYQKLETHQCLDGSRTCAETQWDLSPELGSSVIKKPHK